MNNIEKIEEYVPTIYVNDASPDLDETNLNKTEQAIKRVTDAANKAIDALKQLDREKLALSAISNVLSDDTNKVPSLALANTMQSAINDLNSNLSNLEIKLMNAVLQSVTVEARAASAEISVDVSNLIPDGYRIVDIRPRSSGANACFVSFMDWSGSAPKISYVVRNVTDERVTATPSAKLLLMPITTQ